METQETDEIDRKILEFHVKATIAKTDRMWIKIPWYKRLWRKLK